MASAKSLINSTMINEKFYNKMSQEYVKTLGLMSGRAPGKTCMKTLQNMALNKKIIFHF